MSIDNRISRRDFLKKAGTLVLAAGAVVALDSSCNVTAAPTALTNTPLPDSTNTDIPTVFPSNTDMPPTASATVTLPPDLEVEGNTAEEMLTNFFIKFMGVRPMDMDGTLKFVSVTTGEVFHLDTVDRQECIEGYPVERINFSLKGSACGPASVDSPTPGQSQPTNTRSDNPEPTRTKKPPVPQPTRTQADGQPVQTTPTDGGSGEHPLNPTQISTPKPTEQKDPTAAPTEVPVNTPSF